MGPWEAPFSFQPTLPLRGATGRADRGREHGGVSTHAPLAGSDRVTSGWSARFSRFNPRSPCGERRYFDRFLTCASKFQPTLPLRGATPLLHLPKCRVCFNPRSPCGERLAHYARHLVDNHVSTHAPLAGSDQRGERVRSGVRVSTHAPLAGSDEYEPLTIVTHQGFQPTLPLRGATRASTCTRWRHRRFQPTLPLRGATKLAELDGHDGMVSTHAPLAGSDCYILLM